MKSLATLFLQLVLILIGLGAAAALLIEPRLEGVNAHASNLQIYLNGFILLVYAGSIPFFIGLYQAFRLLTCFRQDRVLSPEAVRALRIIKLCALAVIGFVVVEEIVILLTHGKDDAAGGVAMGVFISFGAIVVAAAAAIFERTLQGAVEIKSENDLTV